MRREHITIPVERINDPIYREDDDELFEHELDSKHYVAFVVLDEKGIAIELQPKDEDEFEHHGFCVMHISLEHIVSSCGELRRHEYLTKVGKKNNKNTLGLTSVEEATPSIVIDDLTYVLPRRTILTFRHMYGETWSATTRALSHRRRLRNSSTERAGGHVSNTEALKKRVREFFARNNEAENEMKLDPELIEKFIDALEAREKHIKEADAECEKWVKYFHASIRARGSGELKAAMQEGIWALIYSWAHEGT